MGRKGRGLGEKLWEEKGGGGRGGRGSRDRQKDRQRHTETETGTHLCSGGRRWGIKTVKKAS